jgi:hypothetical protein
VCKKAALNRRTIFTSLYLLNAYEKTVFAQGDVQACVKVPVYICLLSLLGRCPIEPWMEMGSRLTAEVGIWLAGHSLQVCLRADRRHLRHENDALRFVLRAFHFQTRVDRLHFEHGTKCAWHLAPRQDTLDRNGRN